MARLLSVRTALLLTLVGCSVPPLGWPDGAAGVDTGASGALNTGVITGTISDGSGLPIEGAYVTSDPLGYESRTDADGFYTIDRLPLGDYQIVAAADGHRPTRSDDAVVLQVDEAAIIDLSLEAAPLAMVEVRVTGPDGLPYEGATVQVGEQELSTDADGIAIITAEAGELDVVVSADGLWPYTVRDVAIPSAGGVYVAATLAGRSRDDSSLFTSNAICAVCHRDMVDQHETTHHGSTLTDGAATELDEWFTAGTSVDLRGGAVAILSVSGDDQVITITDAAEDSVAYTISGWIGSIAGASVPYTDVGSGTDTNAYPLPVAWIAGQDGDYADDVARWISYQDDRWVDANGFYEDPEPTDSAEMLCFACHATGFSLIPRDDGTVRMVWGSSRWREGSVGCEACHGPGSSHQGADTTEERIFTVTQPQLLDRERADQVCAQCHSSIQGGEGMPFPWFEADGYFTPGDDLHDFFDTSTETHWPNLSAAGPNQQADELIMSVHAGLVRCIDCHDPHGERGFMGQLRLDAQDNDLCLSCHEGLTFDGDPDAIDAHTGHAFTDTDGTSGQCIACHMPATTARMAFSDESGAGDLSSHLFSAWPPQDTVDVFDAEGESELPVGYFPIYGCADCHARYNWRLGTSSVTSGDPTQRATHVDFQAAYDERF